MKKIVKYATRQFLNRVLGTNRVKSIIKTTAKIAGIDLLSLAYDNMGILKYWNDEVSGESFVINSFLKERFQDRKDLILF